MNKEIKINVEVSELVKPDTTNISLNFSKTKNTYEEALNESIIDLNSVKEILINLGLDKEIIKTKVFEINPNYESYKDENNNYKKKFLGYQYNQTLVFSFNIDNKLLGQIMYSLINDNISTDLNISYSLKDISKHQNKLLTKACKEALTKAKIICKASNVTLGNIVNIEYNDKNNLIDSIYFTSNHKYSMCLNEIPTVDISPEDIRLTEFITITYNIE